MVKPCEHGGYGNRWLELDAEFMNLKCREGKHPIRPSQNYALALAKNIVISFRFQLTHQLVKRSAG